MSINRLVPNEDDIKKFIAYRFKPEDTVSLRYLSKKGKARTINFKAANDNAIIGAINRAEKAGAKNGFDEPIAFWVNLNHIVENMNNESKPINKDDIDRYMELLFDFDAEYPKDDAGKTISNLNSSETEMQASYDRMMSFKKILDSMAWPEALIIRSGNGYQLRYAINISKEIAEPLIKNLLSGVAQQIKVDTSVFDPARVCKLPGTPTRRGTVETDERPYRMSSIVSLPAERKEVTINQIKDLMVKYPAPVENNPSDGHTAKILESDDNNIAFVKRFLNEHGIPIIDERKDSNGIVYIDISDRYCPNHEEHSSQDTNKTATSIICSDKLGFECHHGHCVNIHWQDFRSYYDPVYRRNKSAPKIVRDTTIADWVLENNNTKINFVSDESGNGEFWIYDGKKLCKDGERKSRRFMEDIARDLVAAYEYQLNQIPEEERIITDNGKPKQSPKYKAALDRLNDAEKYLDFKYQQGVYNILQSRQEIVKPKRCLDSNKELFNIESGVLKINTGELLPHDTKYNMSLLSPATLNPSAKGKEFHAMLDLQFPNPDEQRAIRYIFGGALLRKMRKYWSQVYFYGKRDTAKSTLALFIAAVLGTTNGYAILRNSDFNSARMAKRETQDDRLQTANKALIVIDETKKEKQDNETIKAGSGGAAAAPRGLYKANETIEPTATTINTCNELPLFDWGDEALISRLIFVEFTHKIPNIKSDKPFWEVLFNDEDEKSACLNWLIEGATDNEPPMPLRWIETKNRVALENDIISQFIKERCKLGDGKDIDYRMRQLAWNQSFKYFGKEKGREERYLPSDAKIKSTLESKGVTYRSEATKIRDYDDKGKIILPSKAHRNVLMGIRFKTRKEFDEENEEALKESDPLEEKIVDDKLVEEIEHQLNNPVKVDQFDFKGANINWLAGDVANKCKVPLERVNKKIGEMLKDGDIQRVYNHPEYLQKCTI